MYLFNRSLVPVLDGAHLRRIEIWSRRIGEIACSTTRESGNSD